MAGRETSVERGKVMSLGYVGVGGDVAEWERFAVRMLGLEMSNFGSDEAARFKMDLRAYRLAVHPTEEHGVAYVGWEVQDPEALDDVRAQLHRAGIETEEGSREEAVRRGVLRLIKCADPAGIALEFVTGPRTEEVKPFTSPHGVRFVTGEYGMGHVVFVTPSYEECVEFYAQVLGFKITDVMISSNIEATFLGCNPRHHSFAVAKGNTTLLQHVMLEVDDLNAIGQAYDRCLAGDAPLSVSLGRHWNDHMTSFYVRSPSGFDIEYGWGGRSIERSTWPTVQGGGEGSFWGHQRDPEWAKRFELG